MITVKVHAPCGTIILDRAAKCNALDRQMVTDLTQAFDDLRQERRVRVILLTGAGPHFCAGVDLAQWQETTGSREALQQYYEDSQAMRELLESMMLLPKPIIAAVDGAAVGMGFGLVMASDLVVASHRATFSLPAPKRGLVSGLVAPLIVFRHGASLASRMLLSAEELDAEEGYRLGIVHRLVPSDQIWVRSNSWGEKIAESAAESLQLSKKLLNEMIGEPLGTNLTSGAAATATALTTEAASEGLKAFTEKREPKFP
ncbi:MAG: enoyl-CoA hydratase/isomerase family protein [Pirellulaceae bacterium]|nr:enoyl-CoA hydratase/isomerase family protein [Pirellulaceae bacterium]